MFKNQLKDETQVPILSTQYLARREGWGLATGAG